MADSRTPILNLTEVAEGVHELRLPIPWEDEFVNCYLFGHGGSVDLVDCGIQSADSIALIRRAIAEVGGPSARLRRLVITHIHPDHYGAAGILARDPGVEIYMHRLEIPLVHPRYLELEQLIEEVGSWLRMNGAPDKVANSLMNASRSLRDFVTPADPVVQLDGAETIRLGQHDLVVQWTPGHSPGHMSLYTEAGGLLLGGDLLLPEISPNIGLHPQSTPNPLDDFIDSMERMVALRPRLVLPSHGRPFTHLAEHVERLKAHHERRKVRIEGIIGDRELSGWEVAHELWGRREHIWDTRMALQEGLAHLQSMAVAGRLVKHTGRDAISWRRPTQPGAGFAAESTSGT